jgi:hypothetical protein
MGSSCTARFITSDGKAYQCVACNDCQAAAKMIQTWCGGGGADDTACAMKSTMADCNTCCTMNHPSGSTVFVYTLSDCECNNPGYCQLECQQTLCAGSSTIDSLCNQCLQGTLGPGGCDITTACNANMDCAAFSTCVNACPAT